MFHRCGCGCGSRRRKPVTISALSANGTARRLAGPYAQAVIRAARQSFVDGWQHAIWAGVAVMAVLFFFILARAPGQRSARALAGDSMQSATNRRNPPAVAPSQTR
jgi:hypothetical protein